MPFALRESRKRFEWPEAHADAPTRGEDDEALVAIGTGPARFGSEVVPRIGPYVVSVDAEGRRHGIVAGRHIQPLAVLIYEPYRIKRPVPDLDLNVGGSGTATGEAKQQEQKRAAHAGESTRA